MDLERDFVQLSRLALIGNRDDVILLMRRALPLIREARPDLLSGINALLAQTGGAPTKAKPAAEINPLPVDLDSRLELLRREDHPTMVVEPTWPHAILNELNQFVSERNQEERLIANGIMPTRSLLLVGPPGVGKSLATRYLAVSLNRTLLTLDLAAVMSSFLGRTGNNIRAVLDYARRTPSILLLDEFDAIAKRRDDSAEIGELKRLVTVLLQAIDDWPRDGILVAATNHPDLLDPAVWRRFEKVIEFPLPSADDIRSAISVILRDDVQDVPTTTLQDLSVLFEGQSFADVRKAIQSSRRESVVKGIPIDQVLNDLIPGLLNERSHAERLDLAVSLHARGWPERKIYKLTGIARDTFRKKSTKKARRKKAISYGAGA